MRNQNALEISEVKILKGVQTSGFMTTIDNNAVNTGEHIRKTQIFFPENIKKGNQENTISDFKPFVSIFVMSKILFYINNFPFFKDMIIFTRSLS